MAFDYVFEGSTLKKVTPSSENQLARNSTFTLCNDYLDSHPSEVGNAMDFFDRSTHPFTYALIPETDKGQYVVPSKENQLARSILLTFSREEVRRKAGLIKRHNEYVDMISKKMAAARAAREAIARVWGSPITPAPPESLLLYTQAAITPSRTPRAIGPAAPATTEDHLAHYNPGTAPGAGLEPTETTAKPSIETPSRISSSAAPPAISVWLKGRAIAAVFGASVVHADVAETPGFNAWRSSSPGTLI